MSVKIKISYEEERELQEIINLIEPKIKRWRKGDRQGKYHRVYIEVK